jgi:hypothetical protein
MKRLLTALKPPFFIQAELLFFTPYCRMQSPQRPYDMNGRFQMQGGKNWILPKEINANRFF